MSEKKGHAENWERLKRLGHVGHHAHCLGADGHLSLFGPSDQGRNNHENSLECDDEAVLSSS